MSDQTSTLSRAQLLYGICLSLAVLIGFLLADPIQSSSFAVLGMVVAVLCWPIFARWHHPLLVFSFHSAFYAGFLPGNLVLWSLAAAGGFVLLVFHRSINPNLRLFPPGGVPWALLMLALVVVVTAMAQGGIGFKALGSASTGSKKYVYILLAIMAYFVLVSRPVPPRWAFAYVALFCLSGLTGLLAHGIYAAGSKFYFLFSFVDPAPAIGQATAEWDVQGKTVFRSTGATMVASAILGLVIARFGIRELFDLKRPWRMMLVLFCLAGGSLGGFRSFLVGAILFLGVLFFLEGLHRTKYLALVLALSLGGFGLLETFSDRLPDGVQRAISFLPVRVDEHVRQDAQGSTEWRLRMWEILWAEVPDHLLVGKGFAIDPQALQLSDYNAASGYGIQAEWAVLAGEYHNGPISVLLPFGIWGALAFLWFIAAAMLRFRFLCRQSPPSLARLNRVLFAMFISKLILFAVVVGSIYSDLVEFVAVLGIAEALNAGARPPAEEETPAPDFITPTEREHA